MAKLTKGAILAPSFILQQKICSFAKGGMFPENLGLLSSFAKLCRQKYAQAANFLR